MRLSQWIKVSILYPCLRVKDTEVSFMDAYLSREEEKMSGVEEVDDPRLGVGNPEFGQVSDTDPDSFTWCRVSYYQIQGGEEPVAWRMGFAHVRGFATLMYVQTRYTWIVCEGSRSLWYWWNLILETANKSKHQNQASCKITSRHL